MDLDFKFSPKTPKESEFLRRFMDLVSEYTDPTNIQIDKTTSEEISISSTKEFIEFPHLLITGGDDTSGRIGLMQTLMEFVFEKYEYPDCIMIDLGERFPKFYKHEYFIYSVASSLDKLDEIGSKSNNELPRYIFLDNCIDMFFHDTDRFIASIKRIINHVGNTILIMSTGNDNSITLLPEIIDLFKYRIMFSTNIPSESEHVIGNHDAVDLKEAPDFVLFKDGKTTTYQKNLY